MATASIIITDNEDGTIDVSAEFGDQFIGESKAHQMIQVLLQSVLSSADRFEKLEDTVPECNPEPSLIVTPETV